MSTCSGNVPILYHECVLDGMEGDDLSKEIKHVVAEGGVRKVRERGLAARCS